MFDLVAGLRQLIAHEGSDLYVKVPSRPFVRVHGALAPGPDSVALTGEDTEALLRKMLTDPERLRDFAAENEVDFSYALAGLAGFRVNAFCQRGSVSLVMRAIPERIKSIEELLVAAQDRRSTSISDIAGGARHPPTARQAGRGLRPPSCPRSADRGALPARGRGFPGSAWGGLRPGPGAGGALLHFV